MRRTLLAVGIAVLASMLFAPHSDKWGRYWWPYFPLFADTGYVLWRDFFAQTAFLAVLAAVLVNLRGRRTTQRKPEEKP